MEKKYVKVPFDVEMAKRISNGEVDGKIITRDGRSVRIVCWDLKSIKNDYSILSIVNDSKEENPLICTFKGLFDIEAESRNDLMLEIPEYMTFKDGDILSSGEDVFILKEIDGRSKAKYYACTFMNYDLFDSEVVAENLVNSLRLATEEEKQKLIDALKASKEPKAKDCLKILGIEQKQEYDFKPFDKVLVRDDNDKRWIPNFYWCKGDIAFRTINGTFWNQCIPYNEQTAHLIGKTDDWKE